MSPKHRQPAHVFSFNSAGRIKYPSTVSPSYVWIYASGYSLGFIMVASNDECKTRLFNFLTFKRELPNIAIIQAYAIPLHIQLLVSCLKGHEMIHDDPCSKNWRLKQSEIRNSACCTFRCISTVTSTSLAGWSAARRPFSRMTVPGQRLCSIKRINVTFGLKATSLLQLEGHHIPAKRN